MEKEKAGGGGRGRKWEAQRTTQGLKDVIACGFVP